MFFGFGVVDIGWFGFTVERFLEREPNSWDVVLVLWINGFVVVVVSLKLLLLLLASCA